VSSSVVNGACQSGKGASSFPSALVEPMLAGTPQRHFVVAGLDEQIAAFCQDPNAIPPLLRTDDDLPWINVAALSPDLAA